MTTAAGEASVGPREIMVDGRRPWHGEIKYNCSRTPGTGIRRETWTPTPFHETHDDIDEIYVWFVILSQLRCSIVSNFVA